MDPAATRRRRKDTTRWLPLAATGRPAPFRLGGPAYLAALGGWVAAAALLLAAAPELVRTTVSDGTVVAAAHTVGLVVFPFAVAAAVWQLVPVMLRNDPPRPWTRWIALPLIAAGAPLAVAVATGRGRLGALFAVLLGAGLALLVAELVALIRGAPPGRTLVVPARRSRSPRRTPPPPSPSARSSSRTAARSRSACPTSGCSSST